MKKIAGERVSKARKIEGEIRMIYLAIGNVVFMLGYIVGKICATYEYNKKIYT